MRRNNADCIRYGKEWGTECSSLVSTNATRCAAPVGGHGTVRTSRAPSNERLVLQIQLLATSVRDGCAPRGCTDTYTSRAGEGVECRDGMRDEYYCVGPRVGWSGIDFSGETCFCLREVVTFGSRINS
jgi:hypothetical protein